MCTEECYRLWCVVVCDLETSRMRRPWSALVRSATRHIYIQGGAKRTHVPWPQRSPDLSACDFFLCGYLKSKVYVRKPRTVDDLKVSVREEITIVP